MIYVIDTGYAGPHNDVLGQVIPDVIGHGTAVINLIKQWNPKAEITAITISLELNDDELRTVMTDLLLYVTEGDIVLMPWVIEKDKMFDLLIRDLVRRCTVVCAAGNRADTVDNYSPTTVLGVHTISCLNKSGELAMSSNYGPGTTPMYGTTMETVGLDGIITISGTTASSAIYTAIYSRNSNPTFYRRVMEMLSHKYYAELQS